MLLNFAAKLRKVIIVHIKLLFRGKYFLAKAVLNPVAILPFLLYCRKPILKETFIQTFCFNSCQ